MNKCYALFMIVMRMCINISLVPMSGPSCMPKSDVMLVPGTTLKFHPFDAIPSESVTRSELSSYESAIFINSDYPARVIPSRFQNLQTLNANISGNGLAPDIANDPATFSCCLFAHKRCEF